MKIERGNLQMLHYILKLKKCEFDNMHMVNLPRFLESKSPSKRTLYLINLDLLRLNNCRLPFRDNNFKHAWQIEWSALLFPNLHSLIPKMSLD